jgi:hypothetical protein
MSASDSYAEMMRKYTDFRIYVPGAGVTASRTASIPDRIPSAADGVIAAYSGELDGEKVTIMSPALFLFVFACAFFLIWAMREAGPKTARYGMMWSGRISVPSW